MTAQRTQPELHHGNTDLTAAATASPYNVALLYAGGRVDKLREPLKAVGCNVSVDPPDPYSYDCVVLDTPGPWIARHTMRSGDTPVLYRLRGNLWKARRGREGGILPRIQSAAADRVLLPRLDGIIAPDRRLAQLAADRSGGVPTPVAELPIRPGKWPVQTHRDNELRLLTLTNVDYWEKIKPIKEWAPLVEEHCQQHGGHWRICGDGNYENELGSWVAQHDHVSFEGYVDAESALDRANVLAHPSRFDIAYPNAILEGMASGLPVLTTDFEGFEPMPATLSVAKYELGRTLEELLNPECRRDWQQRGIEHIQTYHRPTVIGAELCSAIQRCLR